MKTVKRRPFNPAVASSEGKKYVLDYLDKTVIKLPQMEADDYSMTMDAIVQTMSRAWLAGYMKGLES